MPPASSTELPCPGPFTKVGSECFYLSESGCVFGEARAFCLGLGGNLASPADVPALKDYVIGKGREYFWAFMSSLESDFICIFYRYYFMKIFMMMIISITINNTKKLFINNDVTMVIGIITNVMQLSRYSNRAL